MDSWNDFNCASLATEPKSTSSVSSTLCYYNGVYYNDGEIVYSGEGSGDCETLYCSEGVLVPYGEGDCGSTSVLHQPQTNPVTNAIFAKLTISDTITYFPSSGTDQPVKATDPTGTRTMKTNILSETNNPTINTNLPTSTKMGTPVVLSSKPLSLFATTQTTPGPKLCLHNGTFYEEGDIISENFNGDNWCSGLICKDGQLISLNCGDITDIISNEDISNPKLVTPLTTRGPELPLCFHEGRYYEEGDLATTGNDWCSGLICKDGAMVIWDNCEAKVESIDQPNAKQTTTPGFRFSPTTQSRDTTNTPNITLSQPTIETKSITTAPEAKLCFHNETYYEEGDIISEDFDSDNWCSGWICKDGRLISVNCSDISDTISKEDPSSPKLVIPLTTGGPEPTLCFHEGRFYEEDDLATTGNDWCSGLICKDGEMVIWDNCEAKVESIDQPNAKQTTTPGFRFSPTTQSRDTTNTPDITLSQLTIETKNITTAPEAKLCFHNETYYEEGDIISEDFDSDNWCSGWICKDGRLISVNCSYISDTISKGDPSSPKLVIPLTTGGPEPTLCFHEGRFYEEDDLATTGNDWCSGLICKDGEMVIWDNCEVKVENTGIPITKQTTTRSSTSNPTAQSRNATKTPDLPRHTNTITETNNVTKPAKAKMCFHEGKYYEEGDIISQNFDRDNWCSGWICQDGRLISVNCSDIPEKISKDSLSGPKPVLSGITQDPEPSRCFYEGRYYEEGDLATTGGNLCSGLVCKDGEMIVWENCEVNLEGTKPSQVTRTPSTNSNNPNSTLKPPTRTSIIPDTVRSSNKTTDIPDTTTKIPDSTILSFDSTTRTTDVPTKPQQITPTQPPQTTKPEKLRCYYEGALHPPGEVTRGTLTDGRCYGVICDISGVVIQWVSATCEPAEPPTTEIRNTLPGCVYNDKYYPPGRISRVSDGSGWCLDVSCTDEGEIVSINNLQCDKSTTTEPPSTVATTAARTREIKCLYNGICLNYSSYLLLQRHRTCVS